MWRLCGLNDAERRSVSPSEVVATTVTASKRLMLLECVWTIGDALIMTASPRHWFRDISVHTLEAFAFLDYLDRWSDHGTALGSLSPFKAVR